MSADELEPLVVPCRQKSTDARGLLAESACLASHYLNVAGGQSLAWIVFAQRQTLAQNIQGVELEIESGDVFRAECVMGELFLRRSTDCWRAFVRCPG